MNRNRGENRRIQKTREKTKGIKGILTKPEVTLTVIPGLEVGKKEGLLRLADLYANPMLY